MFFPLSCVYAVSIIYFNYFLSKQKKICVQKIFCFIVQYVFGLDIDCSLFGFV